jgi:uncharacterized protein YkwD
MKSKSVVFLILVIFPAILFPQSNGIPKGNEQIPIQNAEFEQEVLRLVNKIRLQHHLDTLLWNDDLARAALYHAQDMAIDDYMEHATCDRKNKQLIKMCGTFERIEKFASFSSLGENISAGQENAKNTVEAWMNSASHRANILNPHFKFLGVGYFYESTSIYKHYWVQDFGG